MFGEVTGRTFLIEGSPRMQVSTDVKAGTLFFFKVSLISKCSGLEGKAVIELALGSNMGDQLKIFPSVQK